MQIIMCCGFLLSFSIQCLYGTKLELEKLSDSDNRNVLGCLDTLISVTDWAVHNFMVISDDMDIVDDEFFQFQRYLDFGWELYSTKDNNLTGFSNVILFTNNFQSLNRALSLINIRRMDTRAKIVISVTRNFASLDEIKIASRGNPGEMWKSDKTRVLYLVPCKEDILAMTYFPFARNCQVGELEILDVWMRGDFQNRAKTLFPEKMLDIRGCIQNHTSNYNFSQLQLRKEYTDTGEMIMGGVAGRLITIVAEKMNMTLKSFTEPIREYWVVMINQLRRGEIVFSVGGNIPTAGRAEIVNMDTTFMEESYALAYIFRGYEVSWKNLLSPLPIEAWGYIGWTLVLFGSIISLTNRCRRQGIITEKLTMLDTFGIFLGSSRVLPRSYFGRYLLGMWIVYSYLINSFYNSGLVSFLTSPDEQRVINTFEDLLADGMDFGDAGEFHREFYHDPSDPIMMKIYNNFKTYAPGEGRRKLYSGQTATGIFSSTVYQYNHEHSDNVNCQLRMLKDKAFTFQAPIFMRRGSPFTIGIHRYSVQVIESGLSEYWYKHYTGNWDSARKGTDTEPSKISRQHLRGVWYFLIAGLISSSVVFILEIVFYKYVLNRGLNLCNYLN